MSTDLAVQETEAQDASDQVVNDFSITVATVNGSGSQTANLVLFRTIFQMGVPVSGKNLFPSNIAGLPTWYTIRASKDGYLGPKRQTDVLVALNRETAREDLMALEPGSAVVYDEQLKLDGLRNDVDFFPVPFDKLVTPVCPNAKLRRLVRNMIYDGVLGYLLDLDMAEMDRALDKQLGRKPKAVSLNRDALKAGYEYAESELTRSQPYRVARMGAVGNKILIDGNAAAAIGSLMAGVTVVAWYPITPSSSLCETLIDYMRKYRIDPDTGKATFAVVQAEDEIAALGMVLGAGWAGARSMTSTSGPGISLMSEFSGLAYFAEVPAVIFDVQRVGPSTGLPTRTAQGDLLSTAVLSHGDTKHPMFFPHSVDECYEMAMQAFDVAERFQTPVFVMSDLDLGMNTWMSAPFEYPDKPIDRGKRLDQDTLDRLGTWGRYKDVDGDGVPYRSIPGDGMPAYFCRGSGHSEMAQYTERSEEYEASMQRLDCKFATMRANLPAPVEEAVDDATVGIIAYGTTHWAVVECLDQLKREASLAVSYLRVRAYPLNPEIEAFVQRHQRVYVVEQNRDGQLFGLMRLELEADSIARMRSIRHYNGQPIDARTITNAILAQEGQELASSAG